MNISRLLSIVFAVAALIGGISAVSAQTAATEEGACSFDPRAPAQYRCDAGDQEVTGNFALVGPRGEQVAVYCVNDIFQHAARPDGLGGVIPSGSALAIECNSTEIYGLFPGYRAVVNTSPVDGWTIDPRNGEASICQSNGVLTTVSGTLPGGGPDWESGGSMICAAHSMP